MPFNRLILFGALSVADFFLTWGLIERSGGVIYESNPIAGWWLKSYGWFGLALFKMLAVGVFTGLVVMICLYRPHAGGRLITFGCTAVAAVVLYSCVLTGFVHASTSSGPDLNKMVVIGYRR